MKFPGKDIFASIVLTMALWAPAALRADVTIRYQSEFKSSPALQPFMEKLGKTLDGGSATSVRMKGNKGYTTAGNWTEIFDLVKQEVTLIDPARKTFAAMPASQLADGIAGAIPQATSEQMQAAQQTMASVKTNVDSKITGKTAEIQGVQAEEREVTVTMDIPVPAGMSQAGPSLRLVMHIWTAKKEEALRVPAIRELTGYQAWQKYVLNPVGMLQKMAGKLPGMSGTIGPMLEEIFKNPSVILRTHMEIYMHFMDEPLMEMNQEVAELSSAPIDPSLFEIPEDYAAIPAGDMIRAMINAQK